MPDETRTDIFRIVVEGREAKDALEQLLAAIQKVETAIIGMGEKFDAAVGRMVEPITKLTTSVDALNTSISGMQRNLGDVSAMEAQGRAAQQTTVDYTNLRRAMAEFRQVGGAPGQERYRGPTGGSQIRYGREKFVKAYMRGEYAERGFGPGMGAQFPGAGYVPPTMQLQYETASAAAKELGLSVEELGARTQKTTADFATQSAVIERAATIVDMLKSGVITMAEAEEMLASSTKRSAAATREVTQAERERWLAMGRMPPGLGKGVSGTYAPAGLRQPAMQEVLRQQMGTRPELEWTRPVGREKGVPYEPLKRAEYFGHMEVELEQIQKLETAIGRKLVVQKLMERGSRDVAERFEKQFAVTRSKEEILREISRTGKMTTEMEKELGLQTEQAGRRANRAGNMFRYFGRYLLRYLLLWQGIQAVRGISRAWFAAHVEMSDAVADFGWRVNATAEGVERYRDRLRDVSMMAGVPVGQIASPFAGEMSDADLLKATEAFKVFGGSVEDWARKMDGGTASLDAYAHGLRISTLATEDYAELVDNASAIAQEFNMTEEETIGLLSALPSVLQADAEGAAELTEALAGLYEQNQLLMTLGVAPAVTVGPGGAPQRRPMAEVMAEIGRQPVAQQRQLAVAIGLTGEKQQQFFLDAVAGWGEVARAIQETVDATGDMADALAGADERLKTHVDSMKTALSGLLESFGTIDALKDVVDVITMSFKGWGMMIEWVGDQAEILEDKVGWLYAVGQGPFGWLRRGIGAAAEFYRGEQAEQRAGGAAAAAGVGFTGVTPSAEGGGGAAYFPPMPTLRMGEGMGIGQLAAEMERVIDEVFTRPYTTASGEVIQVTKEQIDALRKNTVILDETGEAIGLLNVYGPALAVAQENLKTEMEQQRFNLERLQDITPQQFDTAMRTILPTWEARLAAIPGFEEEKELQTFFVGEQDILRQQLATQTGMAYTLQDILDTEKDQLEGMWNIPSGVTMRVPLQSLDLMRWMQQGAGGGVATDMMPTGGPLEAAATAQDNAAMAMQASAGAQTAAATSMSQLAQRVGADIYGGVPVEPGVARAEAEMGELPAEYVPGSGGHGRRGRPGGRPFREIPAAPIGTSGIGAITPLAANIVIQLVSTLVADGKKLAEVIEPYQVRKLVNTTRTAGTGSTLRP